jgi:hypothetical protein
MSATEMKSPKLPSPTTHPDDEAPDDILWGAKEIGDAINREPNEVYEMLRKGLFKTSVKKFGHRTMGGRRRHILEALFGEE